MRRTQGKNIVGYVTVHVRGENPEYFFQACANTNIPVWDIKKQSNNYCTGKIFIMHIKRIKRIKQYANYEIKLTNQAGFISFLLQRWMRKELILSVVICSLLIFVLVNIVWKVEVTGVSTEIEMKINEQLTRYGLYEGAWSKSLTSLDIIQQDILHAIPELLYIGIQKKGTTYLVDGVEKLIVKEEEKQAMQHLIAAKDGIIQKMFVKQGLPVVSVNDFVQAGDLLVSGVIGEETDENVESIQELVVAEGDVYANTWYEVSVTSSLYLHQERLTGEYIVRYGLKFNNVNIPLWNFKKQPFETSFSETEAYPIYLFKWEIPIQFTQTKVFNEQSFIHARTIEEAKEIAINHAKSDLQVKLGKDAQILNYYVLHESVENGKVKLNLYISILENIAKGIPIE